MWQNELQNYRGCRGRTKPKERKKKAQMEYKKKGKQTHSKKTTQSAEQMEQLTEAKMANNQQ